MVVTMKKKYNLGKKPREKMKIKSVTLMAPIRHTRYQLLKHYKLRKVNLSYLPDLALYLSDT